MTEFLSRLAQMEELRKARAIDFCMGASQRGAVIFVTQVLKRMVSQLRECEPRVDRGDIYVVGDGGWWHGKL